MVINKREFTFDENGKCDRCHSLGDIFNVRMDLSEELENKLLHTFIHYEDCGHKVCHECIEKASDCHSLKLEEIDCPKCKTNLRFNEEQERQIKRYCHCPNVVDELIKEENEKHRLKEERFENMTEHERTMNAFATHFNVMRIYSGFSGFPMEPVPPKMCQECNKEQMYYIGIDDNLKRLTNNI